MTRAHSRPTVKSVSSALRFSGRNRPGQGGRGVTETCVKIINQINTLMKRLAVICLLLAGGLNGPLQAQTVNLSAEQLAQLQALSPAQRAALLEQLSTAPVSQAPLAEPVDVLPRVPAPVNDPAASPATAATTPDLVASDARADALEPFGCSLFAGTPTTFAPATNIPVPANNIMGPGDTVIIQLY